jgi:hypothetical protein
MPRVDVRPCTDGATYAWFGCPGCGENHAPAVARKPESVGPTWGWNGDVERPTFTPSILVRATVRLTDDEHDRLMRGQPVEPRPLICHSFVRDGRIQFLSDCTHALAGQTVDLPEVEP